MGDPSLTALYSRHQLRANALDRLLNCFSDLSNSQRTFDEVLDIAVDSIPCEAASLLLVTGEDGTMTFVAATGPVADKIKGLKMAPGVGIAGACATNTRLVTASDVQKDPRFAKELSASLGFETRSILAVPILTHGNLGGVIELINKTGSDEWARHEIELMERIARATGAMIHLIGERG